MINALRYEPQGQHQRFEPQEQQRQDRHIHLHFHLNLTFRARHERSIHPNAIRLRRILAALLAATVMPLLIAPLVLQTPDGTPPTALENMLLVISCISVIAGLALAWCAIGVLLRDFRRASPREQLGLVPPLVLLLIPIAAACILFGLGAIPIFLVMLFAIPYIVMIITHPLITALLLMWVCHEAGTLRQQTSTHSKPGFVVVGGMLLMVLGGILFNIQAMLGGGISPLLYLSVICIAIIVAIRTLVGIYRSRENRQASPKDASPFDIGSSGES